MQGNYPGGSFLADFLRREKFAAQAGEKGSHEAKLDSAQGAASDDAKAAQVDANVEADKKLDGVQLDDAGPAAAYAAQDVALKAAAAVQEWAETSSDDLDDGENLGDRLMGLLLGVADDDMDGEIGEAEQDVVDMAIDAAYDYLLAKGIPEDDVNALLSEFNGDVASRVQELLISRLPDGADASAEDIDAFAFADGDGSQESMFDSAGQPVLDAVYKKRMVIRGGRKVRVNKRVSGTVRLNAKQKLAVRKMLRKTHSAAAQMRRAKSMRVRSKMAG